MARKRLNARKFAPKQGQWHSVDRQTIQELSSTGRHQECLQACQQLLQSEPENPLPWKYAGKSLLALGQFEKALQCLSKAHQLNANDPEIAKDIGNSHLRLGNVGNAEKWYKISIDIDNNYAPSINNIANIEKQRGNHEKAIELFKKAIQADPLMIQPYLGTATAYLSLDDLKQAEFFATKAKNINTNQPGIWEIMGVIHQAKGSIDKAIEDYERELAINPSSISSLVNIGTLLFEKGQKDKGTQFLKKAAIVNPSEKNLTLLAYSYQSDNKLNEAINIYRQLIDNKSSNKDIHYNLGLCLLGSGKNNEAIDAFRTTIEIDNSLIPAWGNLGKALMNEGRNEEALTATKKVLELDPNNPIALMNMGNMYKYLGNLNEALLCTEKSIEAEPRNADAHISLGNIYKQLGKHEKALISTYKCIEIDPTRHDAYINLGSIYNEHGQYDQALDSTLKAIAIKPNDSDALNNLGSIYKNLYKFEEAMVSTKKSLAINPDNPDSHLNLGSIYRDMGEFDKALKSTIKSLELKPDQPIAYMNLGSIYKDIGKLDEALTSTLKSLELKPNNSDGYMNLGCIYQDLGELEKALSSSLKSLELKPNNPSALMNLGSIYNDLGMLDKALASTLKSLELNPDSPTTLMNLGMTYETLNELEQAFESYTRSASLIIKYKEQSSLTSMISAITVLLQMNRLDEAKELLSKSVYLTTHESIALRTISNKNKKHNDAYISYLRKLIPSIPSLETQSESKILHLGESHCLTFTNQSIRFQGKDCTVEPSLVKGAKAFHLSEGSKVNLQKIGFEERLKQNLGNYEYIFLSFGEIDCREDEGILTYCKRSDKKIQDVTRMTASNYFEWTITSLSGYKEKLVYFGTPAPFRVHLSNSKSMRQNEQRRLIIKLFNSTLAVKCQKSGVKFIDVYKLTVGKDGYNNNEWMIDSFHLRPQALTQLIAPFKEKLI